MNLGNQSAQGQQNQGVIKNPPGGQAKGNALVRVLENAYRYRKLDFNCT